MSASAGWGCSGGTGCYRMSELKLWKVYGAAVLVTAAIAVPSLAQDDKEQAKQDGKQFEALQRDLDGRADLWMRRQACPADLFQQDQTLFSRWDLTRDYTVGECEADPAACLKGCFDDGNEDACFQLAYIHQQNAPKALGRYSQALFAQACAAGSDGGCTNRAAGILRGTTDDEPFLAKADQAPSCVFRSFEVTCEAGDAWGCTMLGWQYTSGEAVAVDTAKAKAAFEKSCAISPDFVACDYARTELERLNAPDGAD